MADLKKLGRYELRRVLGTGAMGVVYEGYDPTLGRQVAVKTILRSVAIDAETERSHSERFLREAKAVARLNHPHIVQVHDFGEENEVAYLVMEFIQGQELRQSFESHRRFTQEEVVRIMSELLEALEFAHEAGVVHRDVKPANVMLDAQGRVKLADFGVARIQDSGRSAAGTMVGTPAFMSPEQISGGKIDRRTDVFSAGVVLYQLLTGEQPFKGEGAWTVAKQIMEDDPAEPSLLVKNVPPAFDAIVDKALAKKPAERFASAKEFREALRAVAGGAAAPAPGVPLQRRARSATSEAELEFWRSIQNSGVAAEFEEYLRQFPEGTYAGLARVKLNTLRAGAPAQASSPGIPAAADSDATVAMPPRAEAPQKRRSSRRRVWMVVGLIFASIGIYKALHRQLAPAVDAPAQAPAVKAEVSAADIEKIRREAEERVRREYADKSAAEQAAAAKIASEKAIQAAQEKAAAAKLAAEKQAADKAFAEKLAAAKSAGERAVLEKQAAERAAAEKAAAEKAAAEKAAAEKLAAEKAAAEKAAPEKAAAAKQAGPSHEQLLEGFIQKYGREKVVAAEPPNVPAAMRRGEVVYVNDGSCGPGRIREVLNTADGWSGSFTLRPREYRCISLRDGTATAAPAPQRAPEKAAAENVASAAPRSPNRSTPQVAAALEKFMARVGAEKVLEREPGWGHMTALEVVYVNDGSCPEGEINEVIGGNRARDSERRKRCIKLGP